MKICAMIADLEQYDFPKTELLNKILYHLYYDYGIRRIMVGVHLGTELELLSYLVNHKKHYPHLTVDGVFSYEEEANLWQETDREQLYYSISKCDRELVLKPVFQNDKYFQRNIIMMDMADIIMLFGKNSNTEFWARKINGSVIKIDMEKSIIIPQLSLFRK